MWNVGENDTTCKDAKVSVRLMGIDLHPTRHSFERTAVVEKVDDGASEEYSHVAVVLNESGSGRARATRAGDLHMRAVWSVG